LHFLGWNKVSTAVEELARSGDPGLIRTVLDGLAAFESHPQIVELLDRLAVILKGDLRNQTILLLERKRLGLELDKVIALFKEIQSPYRIEKALGQGLFTAAYLARAEEADLQVVVRVLRPEFVAQPQVRAQFLDLSKKALPLIHENLVLTREVRAFPERNIYFVVRDYVNGVTLQKLLEKQREFDFLRLCGFSANSWWPWLPFTGAAWVMAVSSRPTSLSARMTESSLGTFPCPCKSSGWSRIVSPMITATLRRRRWAAK
jgi:hypothetical protein